MKKQCEALALRTGAEVSFEPGTMPAAGTLRPGAHDAIYRVAQEALANVARHARAKHVSVSMAATPRQYELRIVDDGTGLMLGAVRGGMGLSNMQSRAAEFGGRLSFESSTRGTQMILTLPLMNRALRKAWYAAGVFGLFALSTAVFYGIRGPSSDRAASLWFGLYFAAFTAAWLASAYRKESMEQSR